MMKSRLFLVMMFFAAAVFGQNAIINGSGLIAGLEFVDPAPESVNQDNPLIGAWVIDTTVQKRTIDGVSVPDKVFPAGDTTKTFSQRPVKITFAADQITFEYAENTESATYTITGNTLQISFPTHLAEYRYKVDQGKLQLNHTTKYVIVSDDKVQQVEAEYTYKGTLITKEI